MVKQTVKKTTQKTTRKTAPKATTAKRVTTRKTVTKSRTKTMPSMDQIRTRAHDIYQRRNGGPGNAHADWTQAERELMAELGK